MSFGFSKKPDNIVDINHLKEDGEQPFFDTDVELDLGIKKDNDIVTDKPSISLKFDKTLDSPLNNEELEEDNAEKDFSEEEVLIIREDLKEETLNNNVVSENKRKTNNNFNLYITQIGDYLRKKFGRNKFDLLIVSLNESMYSLLFLVLSIFLIFYSVHVYALKSKFNLISSVYKIKNEIKIEDEKKKANKEIEKLADVIKFGTDYNGEKYPKGGYLQAFSELFPSEIGDLNIATFIEGWSSDFVDYNGEKIRIDNDIISSFKKEDTVEDNGFLKGYTFTLELKGDANKIKNFIYNLKYNNKIPKVFKKIVEKYNNDNNTLNASYEIVFYISK